MKTKIEKSVSVLEMVNVLMTISKQQFVYCVYNTEYRMNKSNNPYFGRVRKITYNRFMLGYDYQNRVNNNMNKEDIQGTFVSQKPSGRTHVSKCVTIDDKTNSVYYVNLEYFKENKLKTEILLDGEIVTDVNLLNDIKSFKVKSYPNTNQPQEKKVEMITPKVENLTFLSMNGIRYTIEK
jgi:hypothetical protein